jgi:hypothetical protein
MDEEEFWPLIDEALRREAEGGGSGLVAGTALVRVLVDRLDPGQVVLFSGLADEVADRAATWDLVAVCKLIDGSGSDDAFRDFCDFLVLSGRSVFERAVVDADSLAEHPGLVLARRDGLASSEPINNLAQAAWAQLTGNDDVDDWFDAFPSVEVPDGGSPEPWPRGTPWESWLKESYEARLPRLFSLIGFGRGERV